MFDEQGQIRRERIEIIKNTESKPFRMRGYVICKYESCPKKGHWTGWRDATKLSDGTIESEDQVLKNIKFHFIGQHQLDGCDGPFTEKEI